MCIWARAEMSASHAANRSSDGGLDCDEDRVHVWSWWRQAPRCRVEELMEPILQAEAIDKRFPGVDALKQVDLDVFAGEIHILLGENGAGKSTLFKVLSGVLSPEGGRIRVGGQEFARLTPRQAQALGIGMVHQELSLVPALSVAENILLGRLPRKRSGVVDWKGCYSKAKATLGLLGLSIPVEARVEDLPMSERQLVEIARVLSGNPRILLLDEPTSALSAAERERLFGILERLKAELATAVLYTTHRLAEVFVIGQKVTIMRDGEKVGTLSTQEATEDKLIEMMIGRCLSGLASRPTARRDEIVLKTRDLTVPGKLHKVSFALGAGEILGVCGLMGAGQRELTRAIFGLERAATGDIHVAGEARKIRSPSDAVRLGLGYLPRDRHEALVPMLPIPPNITLARRGLAGLVSKIGIRTERKAAQTYVDRLSIVPPRLDREVVYLSGGNQQKVVLARWLHSGARVLILDDPTRGIDVGAKEEVFNVMNELAQNGVGMLFISSEIRELLRMADRILVLREGWLVAEYERQEADEEALLRSAMLGQPMEEVRRKC